MERLSMNGAEMNTRRAEVAPLAAALVLLTRQAFDSAAVIRGASIEAASSISSCSGRRAALSAASAGRELEEPIPASTLRTVSDTGSWSARGDVPVEAGRTYTLQGEARRACLESATSISSRAQRTRAVEVLERGGR